MHAIRSKGKTKRHRQVGAGNPRLYEFPALLNRAGCTHIIRRLVAVFDLPLISPPLVVSIPPFMPSTALPWASRVLWIEPLVDMSLRRTIVAEPGETRREWILGIGMLLRTMRHVGVHRRVVCLVAKE